MAPAPGPTGGPFDPTSLVLHLGAAGLLSGLGVALGLTFLPLVGGFLTGVGLIVGVRGVWNAVARRSLPAPSRAVVGVDPRLLAAYDRAQEALDGSPGVDEEQKLELGAALRAGLDEAQRLEGERSRLTSALSDLPVDGVDDARASIEAALLELDAYRDAFLDHCGRLQATLATMALGDNRAAALTELSELTSGLGSRAEADREIHQALSVRPKIGEGR